MHTSPFTLVHSHTSPFSLCFGRLDAGRQSSLISLCGIAVSFAWAVFNFVRGRMARTHAAILQERSAGGTSATGASEGSGDAELAI